MQENTDPNLSVRKRSKGIWVAIALFLLFFLLIGLIASVYLTDRAVIFQTGAAGSTSPSLENSYIFASPLRAGVGGEKIRITVFILDSTGKGVFGKTVELGEVPALDIAKTQNVTDETGKAVFDVSSRAKGLFSIEAVYDGNVLPQRIQATFE